MHTELFVKR